MKYCNNFTANVKQQSAFILVVFNMLESKAHVQIQIPFDQWYSPLISGMAPPLTRQVWHWATKHIDLFNVLTATL